MLSMPKDGTPYDMEPDDLIVVSTTVYGTKDSPRGWYKKLDGILLGPSASSAQPGFYVLTGQWTGGESYVKGLLLVHVDDLLWSGDEDCHKILTNVQGIYKFGFLEKKDFRYCGHRLRQDEKGIHVSRPDLIGRVRPIDCSGSPTPRPEERQGNRGGKGATQIRDWQPQLACASMST